MLLSDVRGNETTPSMVLLVEAVRVDVLPFRMLLEEEGTFFDAGEVGPVSSAEETSLGSLTEPTSGTLRAPELETVIDLLILKEES